MKRLEKGKGFENLAKPRIEPDFLLPPLTAGPMPTRPRGGRFKALSGESEAASPAKAEPSQFLQRQEKPPTAFQEDYATAFLNRETERLERRLAVIFPGGCIVSHPSPEVGLYTLSEAKKELEDAILTVAIKEPSLLPKMRVRIRTGKYYRQLAVERTVRYERSTDCDDAGRSREQIPIRGQGHIRIPIRYYYTALEPYWLRPLKVTAFLTALAGGAALAAAHFICNNGFP